MGNEKMNDSRGTKTMEQLLSAGMEAFALYGLEGVSTRQLAKAAGVNSAAIAYYFGGKDGYYIAVIKYVLEERIKPLMGFVSEIQDELLNQRLSRAELGVLLEKFIYGQAVSALTNPDINVLVRILSREQLQPTSAFDMIYTEMELKLHTVLSEILARITGRSAEDAQIKLQTHAIMGQIVHFGVAKTTICRRMNWENITAERAEEIALLVTKMVFRSLGLECP
jgi:AcrR family transcriptional regulator